MNLSRKRPRPSAGGAYPEIMGLPQSKRPQPRMSWKQLTPADREAIERVASILQKPIHELLEDSRHDTNVSKPATVEIPRSNDETMSRDFASSTMPTTELEFDSPWEQSTGYGQFHSLINSAPSVPFLGHEQSHDHNPVDVQIGFSPQRVHPQVGNRRLAGSFENVNSLGLGHTGSWSDGFGLDEAPWTGLQAEALIPANFQGRTDDSLNCLVPQSNGQLIKPFGVSNGSVVTNSRLWEQVHYLNATNDNVNPSDERPESDESETNSESNAWEDLHPQRASHSGTQLPSSASSSNSDWSWIEHPREKDSVEKRTGIDKPKSKFLKWISAHPSLEDEPPRKQQRRGPFQDKQLQEETSETRRMKACVRCRMQKKRCLINTNNPNGECLTCQAVSKQKIHTMPCLRYKITECTLYRTGKAPGMEFTFRWPVMKLRDISDWADTETRTISVKSDVCPIPLDLSVRKFVPIPQDSLHKGWMDGKVKKWKEVTPFAIVNMSTAVKDMQDHINTHVFQCMSFFLKNRDPLVQETYSFARRYMMIAPEDERDLLGNFFRLWFAIRRTATIEYIVGEDTIDMAPEAKDPSYPLFGKIPLPPVMIQQLDMILTLGFLQPLRKKVLEDFHKLIVANKPKSWMTVYLITFMFLHSCAALSAENYHSARKHGLRRRYAMPNFISELHHGSNVFLSHYHYCTKPSNPFNTDWRRRQVTPFGDMTTDEIHFLIRTSELVKERKDKIRRATDIGLYEDDLYFLSQMFEDTWTPTATEIDYDDGTVGDVPLQRKLP